MPSNFSGQQYGIASMGTRGVTSGADMMGFLFGSGDPAQQLLKNGGFDIWTRGTGLSGTSAGAYVADRWWMYSNTGTPTATQVAYNDELGDYAISVNTGPGVDVGLGQPLEATDCRILRGKQVTFSVWLRKVTGYLNNPSIIIRTCTGAENRFANTGTVGGNQATIQNSDLSTTEFRRFSVTATVPVNCAQIACIIQCANGSTMAAPIEIRAAMLNIGTVAQPFARAGKTIGGELALCQRYCYAMKSDTNANRVFGHGDWAIGSLNCYPHLQFPVQMRATPTLFAVSAANTFGITAAGSPVVLSAAPVINQATAQGALMTLAVASGGGTPGTIGRFYANGTTGASLVFDAEL